MPDESPASDADGIDLGGARAANPFWDFSLRVYAAPGVASACLAFQDRHGGDVNLVLLCAWLGYLGIRIDAAAIAKSDKLLAGWRDETIEPLRAIRRRLKETIGPFPSGMTADLRDLVKQAELESERLAQDVLYRSLESLPGKNAKSAERSGVARLNLQAYAAHLGLETTAARGAIEPLIAAVRAVLEAPDEKGPGL